MIKNILLTFIFIFTGQILFIESLFAEQKVIQGDYQIHHSVFPSNVLNPEVAAVYKIKRSGYRAVVNITPQKIMSDGSIVGVKAGITGSARNLIGNTKTLEFREIIEGDVVYYIANFSFSNEESFRFNIELTPDDNPSEIIPMTFTKKFYSE